MFVGHYGVSFGAKSVDRSIPLWVLFIAVQLLDVIWAPLVHLGVEKVRIVPGFTATNPLDLYYMPYTHGLLAAIAWSCLGALAYRFFFRPASSRSSVIVGVAVFSHWMLDLIVHRPDLPLYDNSAKVGLGLWNAPAIALALEVVLLFGGMWLCFRGRLSKSIGTFAFGAIMVALQSYIFFGPPPVSDKAAAWSAILCYAAFAGVIWWLQDRHAGARTA